MFSALAAAPSFPCSAWERTPRSSASRTPPPIADFSPPSTGELEMAEDMAFFVVTGDVVATGDADGMSKTVLQLGQRIRLPKTPSATRSRAWHEPHSTRMAILGNPRLSVIAWRY